MNAMLQKISNAKLFRYGVLAFPLAFASMPLYIHSTDFYATEFGVSLVTLGIVLLALRLFDAFQDPLIGYLSDRFSQQRLLTMMLSMLLLAAGFCMLFNPNTDQFLLWFGVSTLIATSAFSVLTINLNTLGANWSRDYHQKTRIAAWREAIGLSGLLVASALPSLLQNYESKQLAYSHYGMVLLVIALLSTVVFYYWYCHDQSADNKLIAETEAKELLGSSFTLQLKSNRAFFMIYALSMLASAIPAVLILFFIRDRLGAEHYSGLFLSIYFISGIIGMPIWQYVSRSKNKLISWLIAMIVGVLSFLWAFTLGENDLIAYGIICTFSGLALGAELVLPPSILADLIHKNNSTQQASIQFSILTFLSKFSFAVASGSVLWLLGLTNFQPNFENSIEALTMLSFYYALLPCAIKIVAAILLWRWIQTNEENHHEIEASAVDSFPIH